jgi:hypothetical protein
MNSKIEKRYYSTDLCENNKNSLYVFGDNVIHKGKAGQAVIRDCDNSFGIPTKIYPSMKANSFFSDNDKEFAIIKKSIDDLVKKSKKYDFVIFPESGIGTGLAKMPDLSPKLFLYLSDELFKNFNIRLEVDGFKSELINEIFIEEPDICR